jgi:hypothetical protein
LPIVEASPNDPEPCLLDSAFGIPHSAFSP